MSKREKARAVVQPLKTNPSRFSAGLNPVAKSQTSVSSDSGCVLIFVSLGLISSPPVTLGSPEEPWPLSSTTTRVAQLTGKQGPVDHERNVPLPIRR